MCPVLEYACADLYTSARVFVAFFTLRPAVSPFGRDWLIWDRSPLLCRETVPGTSVGRGLLYSEMYVSVCIG